MKKLLLLLLISPMMLNAQIGNIFPTEIVEIISIADGEFYDVPQGYVFQPMISKEHYISVYKNDGVEYLELFEINGRGMVGGGFSVKGKPEFFSGVLLNFTNSDFNFIFEIDDDYNSPVSFTVPEGKFWFLLQHNTQTLGQDSSGFGLIPPSGNITLNSYSGYCCDENGDGIVEESERVDFNGDGVVSEEDQHTNIHYLIAIEMDINKFNNALSVINNFNSNNLIFYPNPTSSLLALNSDKEYDIEVYDMAGNKVMALTGNTIDMSHLSSATYIVKALDKVENEEVSYKVVKN